MFIPYHFKLCKVWFGSKYRILSSRRKPRHKKPCASLFRCYIKKNTFPYSVVHAKVQNTTCIKEIPKEWERGNFLVLSKGRLPHLPCRGVPQAPSATPTRSNDEKLPLSGWLMVRHRQRLAGRWDEDLLRPNFMARVAEQETISPPMDVLDSLLKQYHNETKKASLGATTCPKYNDQL